MIDHKRKKKVLQNVERALNIYTIKLIITKLPSNFNKEEWLEMIKSAPMQWYNSHTDGTATITVIPKK